MTHELTIRVYYEDTDMAGIVYYANYLRYIERARSEWVRELGIDQRAMKDQDGLVFVVRRIEADYLASAKLDDLLVVETETVQLTGVRWILEQRVKRDEDVLFHAIVTVVVMTETGHPSRMPATVRQMVH
ncbi:Acyl-CoA thioester hydrolase YbgC [Thalassovita gelatinovora]|uniref:Acyl-CoA thioester hydrolase YbgC n=1 Tax=Thalassovita gelatinovora TaxID=53501 RepID=A0A0P1FV19_THAGE|nr:tol-pal system-associated acyl-CoA thioesterase [Thalassovita gelatinovora]QIZ80339.1 tol-pal system-associated acyl-CoA thioesterase [Thalassovita gelatinovora]CUH64265.1 Acyl-CoA thioester hydrolase YbgC [Thalassovita gelatinovora]SEQ94177.1 acyl-CoA thioester hydrolase [Thalassovita gelatinovora]